MTNVQATPEVAQHSQSALPDLPGCGQPATARIEAFSPAANGEAGGSLDASVYVCAGHAAEAVTALQAANFNAYRVAGGDGVKRCGDGMDFTGDRPVPLAAPAVPQPGPCAGEPAELVSAAAAGQPALIRIARTNMLRAISRECFAVDRDALPAPVSVTFDPVNQSVTLAFEAGAEVIAWAERHAAGDFREIHHEATEGANFRGFVATTTWRGFALSLAAVESTAVAAA